MHYAGTMADSNAYILKIDGTTTRSVCSIGVACSSALLRQSGTENRHAVPLGLPTFIAEALSAVAAEQFFSGHQWLFSGAFQEHLQWCSLSCGLAIFCWQHMSCHLFKHRMVVTRVMWCRPGNVGGEPHSSSFVSAKAVISCPILRGEAAVKSSGGWL